MNKVAVIVFSDAGQAYAGSRAIRELHREGSITLYADTVITKDAGGTVSVVRASDQDPLGTFSGLLVGSVIGLLAGPVGVAVGGGAGTLVGAAFDLTRAGIGQDFLDEVSKSLEPGSAAVVAEIDEGWQAPLDTRIEALDGQIFRRTTVQVEDELFEKEISAHQAELDALDAELEQAAANQKARLSARVGEAKQRLQRKQEQVNASLESVKREGDAKIQSLKQQIAAARDERKERLNERLAKVRAEYQERTAKLHEALELAKSAVRP